MSKLPLKKYVYVAGIVILGFVLIPLEYGTFKFKTVLYPVLWISLGITGIRLLADKKNKGIIVKLILASGVYLLFTCYFILQLMICRNGDDSILYVNKENASVTIICRSYDCFLTAGPCELYKSRKLIGQLKWTTKFPHKKVDRRKWEEVRK